MNKPTLITGSAGFIGFHACLKLLKEGKHVVGIDNINDYYDVNLKKSRLEILNSHSNFHFEKIDLVENNLIQDLFEKFDFPTVIHLAAQAGVRYSITNPHAYINSNIMGFTNILEACRHSNIKHLVYASSSSVYGSNTKMPFSITDNVDHPVSLYAATKKSNELMAHTYSHLYGIPTTGLRFFTVYGPWGRPDMAYFLFTKAILENKPIQVFNHGQMKRDFTYIDDIVEGVIRVSEQVPFSETVPYKLYNIGNDQPVELGHMIEVLEALLGKKAEKEFLPMQDGDVSATWANIDALKEAVNFAPNTSIEKGLEKFVKWYREFYKI
jgi:UDP-glucuronate 4-epimerase